MMSAKKIHKRISGNKGVTLVELVVSAVIMLVAIIAIVGVVRMGTDMQVKDLHRRQARSIIMGVFEETFPFCGFTTGSYVIPASSIQRGVPTSAMAFPATSGSVHTITGIKIDGRDGTMVINAVPGKGPGDFSDIDTHEITITLYWIDNNNVTETITLTKSLVNLGP